MLCTSGTAAASFHPAVIEASESGVPLLVLTADRPPELRGTGANQAIDQIKLYGDAVRWFSEVGVPEDRPGPAAEAAQAGYWRSLTGRAWGSASGAAGGPAGPVHLNLAFRDPLVPDRAPARPAAPAYEAPDGRAGGAPWVRFAATPSGPGAALDLPWTERGLIVCGDGLSDETAGQLLALAAEAGWPVLAEPSSGARRGPDALSAYQYLLAAPGFLAAHRPDVIVTAGRPGLSRGQTALLRGVAGPARHVVIAAQPGRWDDPARTATDVAPAVRLAPAAGAAPAAPRRPGHGLAAGVAPGRRCRPQGGRCAAGRRARTIRAAAGPGPGRRAAGRGAAVGRVQHADPGPGSAAGPADRAPGAGQPGRERHRRHHLGRDRRGPGPPGRRWRPGRGPDR